MMVVERLERRPVMVPPIEPVVSTMNATSPLFSAVESASSELVGLGAAEPSNE